MFIGFYTAHGNLVNFYLPNPSHQFNFSPCNLCTMSWKLSYLAYATLICTFYYYYYYYYYYYQGLLLHECERQRHARCNSVTWYKARNNNHVIPLLPFQVNSFSTQRKKYSNTFSVVNQLIKVSQQPAAHRNNSVTVTQHKVKYAIPLQERRRSLQAMNPWVDIPLSLWRMAGATLDLQLPSHGRATDPWSVASSQYSNPRPVNRKSDVLPIAPTTSVWHAILYH